MKLIIIILFSLISLNSFSQSTDTIFISFEYEYEPDSFGGRISVDTTISKGDYSSNLIMVVPTTGSVNDIWLTSTVNQEKTYYTEFANPEGIKIDITDFKPGVYQFYYQSCNYYGSIKVTIKE